jgi:hypothetical protein
MPHRYGSGIAPAARPAPMGTEQLVMNIEWIEVGWKKLT